MHLPRFDQHRVLSEPPPQPARQPEEACVARNSLKAAHRDGSSQPEQRQQDLVADRIRVIRISKFGLLDLSASIRVHPRLNKFVSIRVHNCDPASDFGLRI